MKYALFVILFAFLFISCNQQSPSLTDPQHSLGSFAKPPAQSGPHVIRFEGNLFSFAWIIPDPKSGLTAIHGTDIVDLCAGNFAFDVVNVMEIDNPSHAERIMRFEKGDVQTSVWEGVWTPGMSWCDFISSSQLLAYGTTRYVSTDNDLLTFLYDTNNNANAFGFNTHGKISDTNGNTVVFSSHYRAVWDGKDISSFKENSRVILK